MASGPAAHRSASFVLDLADHGAREVATAGAKAATLARLSAAGLPVPEAFVLTTAAFDAASVGSDGGVARDLPPEVSEALETVVARLDGDALAVRSSAIAEDQVGASFAGQYETVLGVRGIDALGAAVRRCWTSASSGHAIAYRATRGVERPPAMAVLIQRLLAPTAAGIAFTADPVTGDREVTIIDAVAGLADRLAAGEASPERWRAGPDGATVEPPGMAVLTGDQVDAVVELGRRVAELEGRPQDIEWAIEGDRVWLLQARPITTVTERAEPKVPVPVEPGPGTWYRDAGHFPNPQSPLGRSITYPITKRVAAALMPRTGMLADGIELADIGGWNYARYVPPGDRQGPSMPGWVLGLLVRTMPALRARVRAARTYIRSEEPTRVVDDWYDRTQAAFADRIRELAMVDRSSLDDDALMSHLDDAVAFMERCSSIHLEMHGAITIEMYRLAVACRELLGWGNDRLFALLAGASTRSSEPARRLAELARLAAAEAAVRGLLERPEPVTPDELRAASPDFAERFEAYRWTYGIRALSRDIADPTLADEPALLIRLIADQVAGGYDPEVSDRENVERRALLMEDARAALAQRPEELARFQTVLRRGERAYGMREDNVFWAIQAPFGLFHQIGLEIGRRMARGGQVDSAADAFFLEVDELREAFRSRGDRHDLVARRKGERRWVLEHPGPDRYGPPEPAPPSLRWLPDEIRLVHEAFSWADPLDPFERPAASPDGGPIQGVGASAGTYTGPARVILSEAEFGKMRAGDVVVCPVTQPTWSVLFPSMGAIVTDTGGALSHPAIIAREFRLPAVVGTGNGTLRLHDGQVVTVDGSAGTVEVVA